MEIFRFREKTAHIDCDRSVEMVKKFPSDVYANDCFSNVFRLACHYHKSDNHDGEIKIAYGFVSSQNERIYCAHAFFIDSDGRVIDPLFYLVHGQSEGVLWITCESQKDGFEGMS